MKQSYCYILANKPKGTLYTGVTSDLIKRVWQHKQKVIDGFTKKYNVDKLVWFEIHTEIEQAITKEKQIKSWKRIKKVELIEKENINWVDLYKSIL